MSGAGWMRKGDVRTDRFVIECKTKMDPNAKSYRVEARDMEQLTRRARMEGRTPLFQVEMGNKRYILMNEVDFLDIIGAEE